VNLENESHLCWIGHFIHPDAVDAHLGERIALAFESGENLIDRRLEVRGGERFSSPKVEQRACVLCQDGVWRIHLKGTQNDFRPAMDVHISLLR